LSLAIDNFVAADARLDRRSPEYDQQLMALTDAIQQLGTTYFSSLVVRHRRTGGRAAGLAPAVGRRGQAPPLAAAVTSTVADH
jgi:hypothetical protein